MGRENDIVAAIHVPRARRRDDLLLTATQVPDLDLVLVLPQRGIRARDQTAGRAIEDDAADEVEIVAAGGNEWPGVCGVRGTGGAGTESGRYSGTKPWRSSLNVVGACRRMRSPPLSTSLRRISLRSLVWRKWLHALMSAHGLVLTRGREPGELTRGHVGPCRAGRGMQSTLSAGPFRAWPALSVLWLATRLGAAVTKEAPMAIEAHEPISESLEDRLRRSLIEAGELLRPEVAQRILEQVAAAVEPLIRILEDRALHETPEGAWAPIHAAGLLGDLRAREAIPALLAALIDEDHRDCFADEVVPSLIAMRSAALEPVLQAYAESSDLYHRMDLALILCHLGVRDERIFMILLEALERIPERGAPWLARYGDARAIEPLRQAYLRASERQREHAWPRAVREGAATKGKRKRRAARQQQKASRKKNRR
jgi:hypothetical protein